MGCESDVSESPNRLNRFLSAAQGQSAPTNLPLMIISGIIDLRVRLKCTSVGRQYTLYADSANVPMLKKAVPA